MAVLKYKNPTTGWEQVPMYGVIGRDVPTGTICSFAGSSEPTGYLFCDGRSLSRSEYVELFNVIGETYGFVDKDHFNLPNIQERVIIGMSGNLPYNQLGNIGGEEEHTLTIDEMPSHNHTYTNAKYLNAQSGQANYAFGTTGSTTDLIGESTRSTGGGQPHNNMQPYIVLNYIIKAFKTAGVIAQVEDTLTSSSRSDALSAKQGMVLNQRIDAIEEEGVGDSLPIGSIINYDGNNVPEGWESIANPNYSTEETMTGQTWIDGKPLYRKVLHMSGTTSGEKSIDISNLNYEFIIIKNRYFKSGNFIFVNDRYNVNTPNDIIEYYIANNTKQLKINIGAPWANFETYIVVEYTKTTD